MNAAAMPDADETLVAESLVRSVEALLMAADEALSRERLVHLLADFEAASRADVGCALAALEARYAGSALELVRVAGGWRFQIAADYSRLIGRLWQQRPPRLSRAMLETLALIGYRQPITRSEIEDVRGVSVSSQIIRSLQNFEWIHVVGRRELPGRPALFATTQRFLADFGLASLDDLPALAEIGDDATLETAINRLEKTDFSAGLTAAAESDSPDSTY